MQHKGAFSDELQGPSYDSLMKQRALNNRLLQKKAVRTCQTGSM